MKYNCETPKERYARRHAEDKATNPDRHNPAKESYTYEETVSLCPWCAPTFKDKYAYDFRTNKFFKKKK